MHASRVVILARRASSFPSIWSRFLTLLLPLVIDAALGEILTTCSKMEWLIKHGEKAIRTETRPSNLMMFYKKSQVIYEPLGVVSAIVSWNYRMSSLPSFSQKP